MVALDRGGRARPLRSDVNACGDAGPRKPRPCLCSAGPLSHIAAKIASASAALRATVSPLIRGGHVPKHRLFRPISIAAATWPRVADGFDKTAETASHFVGAFSRSPAQPVNMKANNRATILIGAIHENKSYRSISTASCRLAKRVHQKTRELVFVHLAYAHRNALPSSREGHHSTAR